MAAMVRTQASLDSVDSVDQSEDSLQKSNVPFQKSVQRLSTLMSSAVNLAEPSEWKHVSGSPIVYPHTEHADLGTASSPM